MNPSWYEAVTITYVLEKPQKEVAEIMGVKLETLHSMLYLSLIHIYTVYVTETGLVYHRDYHCTHLELSIHMVLQSEIESLRNEGGGKYHPCQHCMKGAGGGVYITDTGDRYHSSLSCSGLKRTIYAVPLSEVAGKGACSRCGK